MATGTVKWFNTQKGYGFIAPQNQPCRLLACARWMKDNLLASVMAFGLAMPAMADQSLRDQEGQAACDGKIFYGNHRRTNVPPPGFRPDQLLRAQQGAADDCKRWQADNVRRDAWKQKQAQEAAAKEQAKSAYVPQYETSDREWHLISRSVHGNLTVVQFERYNIRIDPETGAVLGYNTRDVPHDTRIALDVGDIFSVAKGGFDPSSIETQGSVFGIIFSHGIGSGVVTFPTAAADPNPLECQIDNKSSRVLEKTLLRCRVPGTDEWTVSNE